MMFHETMADDSHEISLFIFFQKLGKMSQNLSSAAVVIGACRVKLMGTWCEYSFFFFWGGGGSYLVFF